MYQFVKRFIDIVLSVLGLIILSPLFILIIISIKLDSQGPVLFRQKRYGKNEVLFYFLKFRTIFIDTLEVTATRLLENQEHWIKKIGIVLRKTSINELPQIINNLKLKCRVVI